MYDINSLSGKSDRKAKSFWYFENYEIIIAVAMTT